MKERISATIDDKTGKIISELVKKRLYRNKSHAIEEGILLLQEKHNGKNKR